MRSRCTLMVLFFGASCGTPRPTHSTSLSHQVWFTPDLASADLRTLFSAPEEWPSARAKIDVFKFYTQWLKSSSSAECASCADNLWPNIRDAGAITFLKREGIAIALESGVLKTQYCAGGAAPAATAESAAAVASIALDRVASAGGQIAYVAMDEPYFGGENECHVSSTDAVSAVVEYARLLKARSPAVQLGDIEPYPAYSEAQLEAWLGALVSAGFTPAFFHLDVNFNWINVGRISAAQLESDLATLQAFCDRTAIPFGVIAWPAPMGGAVGSDQDYYQLTLQRIGILKSALAHPATVLFQSWVNDSTDQQPDVPRNLPESGNHFSHTQLINDGLMQL